MAEPEGDGASVDTYPALIHKYTQRPRHGEMAGMSLFEVAKKFKPSTGGRWSRNRKEAIVRVFPRLKLTTDEEKNEDYYRLQVLLHVPWRLDTEFDDFASWHDAFDFHGVVPVGGFDMNAAVAAAAAEVAAEQADEGPNELEEDPEFDEWMVNARMGPHGNNLPEIELGRREMDLAYDWHANAGDYGDIGMLRSFVATNKGEHVVAEEELEAPDVAYTPEQQCVLALLDKQLDVLNGQGPAVVRRVIVQGKAGTGKSTLIQGMKYRIWSRRGSGKYLLMAFTAIAATHIDAQTIHSVFKINPKSAFKELQGESLRKFQDAMEGVEFVIIDEFSMVGCKLLGYIDRRLRQGKPGSDEPFGGCHVYLIGDIRQLPPIGDPPLYTRVGASAEAQRGILAYRSFQKSFILAVSQRQTDNAFRDALDRLSLCQTSDEDYALFQSRFILNVSAEERELFRDAPYIYTRVNEVQIRNTTKITEPDLPVARLPAKHNVPAAAAGTSQDAQNLEKVLYLSKGTKVMLRANLWTQMCLVNGSIGTVVDILYAPNKSPPEDPPAVVMVKFDNYRGPTMADGSVPLSTVVRGWESRGVACSREQFPLTVAYASTVHKVQGLTEDRAVVSVGPNDFAVGLMYVAMSRVKTLEGLLLDPEFNRDRALQAGRTDAFRKRMAGERDIVRKCHVPDEL